VRSAAVRGLFWLVRAAVLVAGAAADSASVAVAAAALAAAGLWDFFAASAREAARCASATAAPVLAAVSCDV
jgi:hypothetical protein